MYDTYIYIHINIPRQSTLGKLYIHRLDYMNPIWKKKHPHSFLKKGIKLLESVLQFSIPRHPNSSLSTPIPFLRSPRFSFNGADTTDGHTNRILCAFDVVNLKRKSTKKQVKKSEVCTDNLLSFCLWWQQWQLVVFDVGWFRIISEEVPCTGTQQPVLQGLLDNEF